MAREVLRAEEALLLGGHRGEEDAPPRRLLERGVRAGHGEHQLPLPRHCPRPRCRWRPRRAEHRCACRGGRGARCRARPREESRGSLPGSTARTFAVRVRSMWLSKAVLTAMPSGTGWNSRRFAERTSSSRSRPASPTSLRQASSVTQPRTGTRRSVVGDRVLRAGPGAAHHLPGVAGAVRGVEDERPGGADPGGHLVLVVPPAVPEPRAPGEEGRIVLGVAVEDDQHLPAEVLPLEVVPGELRGADAVADEDQLGAIERGVRGLVPRDGDELVRVAEDERLPTAGELEGVGVTVDADDVERLEKALGTGRPEPERLELRGDVGLGQRVTPGAGSAALEQVGGEEADMGTDGVGADGPLGDRRGPGGGRGGQRQREGDGEHGAVRSAPAHGPASTGPDDWTPRAAGQQTVRCPGTPLVEGTTADGHGRALRCSTSFAAAPALPRA